MTEAPKPLWKTGKTHIAVRSINDAPFWRAGRKFGPQASVIAKTDLTDGQAVALIAEPALVVSEIDDPNPPKIDPKNPPK